MSVCERLADPQTTRYPPWWPTRPQSRQYSLEGDEGCRAKALLPAILSNYWTASSSTTQVELQLNISCVASNKHDIPLDYLLMLLSVQLAS